MSLAKNLFDELFKSTLLTVTLFALFDIMIQGYQHYHNTIISLITLSVTSYSLYKHFQHD